MNWKDVLEEETKKKYFVDLTDQIKKDYQSGKVFPRQELIFNAFESTPFEKIKVVIIGQDPYHGEGQAIGMSFAVSESVSMPPSLQNIQKEIISDIGKCETKRNLYLWAHQGVFLLNSVLTVRENEPASHANLGWETFTDFVISKISEHRENVVFLLWGKFAKKKETFIDKNKHLVLTSVHPSPLSAHGGFFGCRHFSKTNEYLKSKNIEQIVW